jgi:hydroxymethylglutaryl-CoA lyase
MHPEIQFEDQTLRDGLQGETRLFTMDEKQRIIALLAAAGFKHIQVGAFVHPRRVPQMADTDELVRSLEPCPEVVFSGLVLNARGLERAMACGLTNVALSASVSDSHSRRNTNQSAETAITAMAALIREALAVGLRVQGGLQCVFGCVYEGAVDADRVVAAAEQMAASGATGISLADTTGMAQPRQVEALCGRIQRALPEVELTLHLHDTRGLGLANMLAGYDAGVRRFDVCAGGLGGCPFVRGAAGNVPAEDAVQAFEAMGVRTGIDLAGLVKVVDYLEGKLDRRLPGRMAGVLRAARGQLGGNQKDAADG